jgi:MFS family permease
MREAAQVFGAVFSNRDLRRELSAFLIFSACEWAVWVAILVFAYDRGGASAVGTVAVIQLVPATLVAPLGSVVGDKLPRERALGLGFVAQVVTAGLTAIALRAEAPIGVIYGCAALASCSITLTRPVHYALLPELAQTPRELTASNSASGMLEGLAVFVGPLPAAFLLTHGGPWLVFATASALLVFACLIAFRLRRGASGAEIAEREPLLSGALEGFRELRREHAAALLTLLVGASHMVLGMLDVLTVILALDILKMTQAGPSLMTSSLGVGALAGAAATAFLVGRRRMVPALMVGMFVTGVPLVLVALVGGPPIAALLLLISGAGEAYFAVAGRTLLQRTVKDEVLARVFGLQEAMLMGGLALGAALAPVLVRVFDPRGAFVAAGVLLPLAGLLAWPRLRNVDAAATVPGPELALLRAIPMFRALAPPVLEQLSWKLIPVEVPAGTSIMREGDIGDRFYVIGKGTVKITVGDRLVAERGRGEYVGEIALLRDVPRTATVKAETDVRLLTLEREDFLAAVTGSRPSAAAAHAEIERRLAENRQSEPSPSHNRNNLE